jgi:hypothetical protein
MILNFFFITVFFLCAGINTFSFYSIRPIHTEVSSWTCNDEICTCLGIDSLNEDQICQSLTIPSFQEICQTPLCMGIFLIQSFDFTVWQPPKIS